MPMPTSAEGHDGHKFTVQLVVFSPDGSQLASGDEFTVRIWDTCTGRVLAQLEELVFGTASMSFSFGGSRVVFGSKYGMVQIWDKYTDQKISELEGHE
jgi:WD40 repeat protein